MRAVQYGNMGCKVSKKSIGHQLNLENKNISKIEVIKICLLQNGFLAFSPSFLPVLAWKTMEKNHSSSQQRFDWQFYVVTLNFEIPQVAYF